MQRLEHSTRPWGDYQVLYDGEDCKVKKITVNPGQRLSLQYHFKRREQWTVSTGVLTVIMDHHTFTIHEGRSIFIPLGAVHRAWNRTDKPVSFIEVQTGSYFGEDDIVRVEDDYNRE